MSSNPNPEHPVAQTANKKTRNRVIGAAAALIAMCTVGSTLFVNSTGGISYAIGIWKQFVSGQSSGQSAKKPTQNQTTRVPTIAVPTSTTSATATSSPAPTTTSTPVPTVTPPVPTATPSPAYFDAEFPDNNMPKTIQGPAIVQWADPDCGIFELNQGKTFTWNSDGHYWLFHNQQSLDYFYASYREQYFQEPQNASCIEGPP